MDFYLFEVMQILLESFFNLIDIYLIRLGMFDTTWHFTNKLLYQQIYHYRNYH